MNNSEHFEAAENGGFLEKVMGACAGRRAPWVIAALAFLVTLGSLCGGFALDDHYFMMVFKRPPDLPIPMKSVLDTFGFSHGDPEMNRLARDKGFLPWWTKDEWKVAFLRPVSSLSHWVDFKLWGDRAWPMHLHSVLLYTLLVWCVLLFYKRVMNAPSLVLLAGFMFAMDDAHALPVVWLSNRNALWSFLFGIITLLLHDKWRKDGNKYLLIGATVSLGLGLLGGEAAIACTAYLFSYALFMENGKLSKRLLSLLPYAAVIIIWQIVYKLLGYGVAGTSLYTAPDKHPLVFASELTFRLPLLMFAQLVGGDPSILAFAPESWNVPFFAANVVVLAFICYAVMPVIKTSRTARFWALGALISAVPSCAALAQSRLLFYPSLGAMALVAEFLLYKSNSGNGELLKPLRRVSVRALCISWVVLHIIVSPIMLASGPFGLMVVEKGIREIYATVPAGPEMKDKTLVLVNSLSDYVGSGINVTRVAWGGTMPSSTLQLVASTDSIEVERLTDRKLRIRTNTPILSRPWQQIFRYPREHPFKQGDRVNVNSVVVDILEATSDGKPYLFEFTFEKALDDESYYWMTYHDGRLVPFELPGYGEVKRLEGLDAQRMLKSLLVSH